MPDNIGVHASHCCVIHGCKYGCEKCPVMSLQIPQKFLCEDCDPKDHCPDLTKPIKEYYDRKGMSHYNESKRIAKMILDADGDDYFNLKKDDAEYDNLEVLMSKLDVLIDKRILEEANAWKGFWSR